MKYQMKYGYIQGAYLMKEYFLHSLYYQFGCFKSF